MITEQVLENLAEDLRYAKKFEKILKEAGRSPEEMIAIQKACKEQIEVLTRAKAVRIFVRL